MATPLILKVDLIGSGESSIDTLIERTILKGIPLEEIRDMVERTWDIVKKGAHISDLHSPLEMMGLEKGVRDLVIDIALTRKRSTGKYVHGDRLFFTSEGLRWATPQVAAEHCADRLRRQLVIDATCGQGGQVLSFADTCDDVIGVDIDPLNCLVSILNCLSMKKRNVTIINGDCLDPDVIEFSKDGCAIFSDPARPPGAAEREMDEIDPDPRKIQKAYEKRSSGMCFEIPPYISLDKIEMVSEVEFISLDGRVNRLNIYTGDLITTERSAVVLPAKAVIKGPQKKIDGLDEGKLSAGTLVYEIDPTIVRAGLEHAFASEMGVPPEYIHLDGRRCLLASSDRINSPFLKQCYMVKAANVSEEDLISVLKKLGAGKLTLRYGVDPKDYWKVRKNIENKLSGNNKFQLFKGNNYLILEIA